MNKIVGSTTVVANMSRDSLCTTAALLRLNPTLEIIFTDLSQLESTLQNLSEKKIIIVDLGDQTKSKQITAVFDKSLAAPKEAPVGYQNLSSTSWSESNESSSAHLLQTLKNGSLPLDPSITTLLQAGRGNSQIETAQSVAKHVEAMLNSSQDPDVLKETARYLAEQDLLMEFTPSEKMKAAFEAMSAS